MTPIIRTYQATDKDACLIAFKSNVPLFFTEEEIEEFAQFLDNFESNTSTIKTYYYVVVLNNEIIGCGGFGDKDNVGIISFAWGLIHNHFHKQGFGKILLKYRLEKINELYPFKTVLLDTTQHSYAFFEKNGFVITKITNDYYAKGMHRYDMIKEK